MVGGARCEGLDGQRWISCASRSHDGSAENAKVWSLVRKAPTVDDIGLWIVPHPGPAIRMGAQCNRAQRYFIGRNGAGFTQPLLSLLLHEHDGALLAFFKANRETANRISERMHLWTHVHSGTGIFDQFPARKVRVTTIGRVAEHAFQSMPAN